MRTPAFSERTGASILIPAFNEVDRIGATVKAALAIPGAVEVIVIDDASTDGTAPAAEAAGSSRVIRLHHNKGKGAALDAGLKESREAVLLTLDADLGATASEGAALLEPVLAGECDMAVAVFPELLPEARSDQRPGGAGGGLGIAMKVARHGVRVLVGRDFVAPLSGQRALDRGIVETMGGFGHGYGVETALSGWAAAGGWRIEEVSVQMSHRRTGKDLAGFTHRARQLGDIVKALLWLQRARKRAREAGISAGRLKP